MMAGEIHKKCIFNLLSLSLLICKMEEIITTPQSCWGGGRILRSQVSDTEPGQRPWPTSEVTSGAPRLQDGLNVEGRMGFSGGWWF